MILGVRSLQESNSSRFGHELTIRPALVPERPLRLTGATDPGMEFTCPITAWPPSVPIEEPVPRARGDAQGDDGSPSGGTAAPVTSTDPHPRKSF